MGAVGPRRDGELLVAVGQEGLRVVDTADALETPAHRRVGAVGAVDDVVVLGAVLRGIILPTIDGQCADADVDVSDAGAEVGGHPGTPVDGVEQRRVQKVAVDRVQDVVGVGAVGLEHEVAVETVEHAPGHGDGLVAHDGVEGCPVEVHVRQRIETAMGDGEVDRAPGVDVVAPQIGSPVVEVDGVPGIAQPCGQQRAREAGADHGGSHGVRHRRLRNGRGAGPGRPRRGAPGGSCPAVARG